jgi:hypothetical protein
MKKFSKISTIVMKKFSKISAIVLTLVFMLGLAGAVKAATAPVSLGAADSFAILAGAGITNVPTSTITGNIGLSPASGAFITSGVTQSQVIGTIYTVDAAGPSGYVTNPTLLTSAKSALTAAMTIAANATPPIQTVTASSVNSFGTGTVNNGANLLPGIYKSPSAMGVTGTLTLDGGGDPNAVFIFQAGTTLTTASASTISLINGAQACNVFWQVGSSAAQLGSYSFFKGTILSDQTITLLTGANVEGRLLAFTGSVVLDNNIVLKPTCVTPPIVGGASGSTGANYFANLPLINITKIPSPLNLPSGPGAVTYAYAVTNIGKVPLHTIWVQDNKCNTVQYVSGDTNGNSLLDVNETWNYQCTKIVSATETDTATAHGYANGVDVYGTANATVVVGIPLIPPLIHLVKIPSVTVLPAGGGAVTYSYSVTNPGTVPLSDVSITDDKCTGLPGRVAGNPGDINNNNLLDPGETWKFTCQSNLTQTTTNIGTAEGQANGLTAISFAPATVVVAVPGLPNTGLPPFGGSTLWSIAIFLVGVALGSFGFSLIQKKNYTTSV